MTVAVSHPVAMTSRSLTGVAIVGLAWTILTGLFAYVALGGSLHSDPLLVAAFFVLGTDGIMLALSISRREPTLLDTTDHPLLRDDVSVVIACRNGAEVIGATIERALLHVHPENVIVVSDCSTDATSATARSYGVQVVENRINRNKALSINRVAPRITTRYVVVLDDDTLLAARPLPVALLEQGYSAVAFEVMPVETGSWPNRFQRFKYRKSMGLGKRLRMKCGAISNVSGAAGLFRTSDLRVQAATHSGQFGGEDQQRTMLVHLHDPGRGIAYDDALIETLAPDSWRALFRQRAFKWGMATHETFVLSLRIILSPQTHYLLKMERAYAIFILLTDPIRMALVVALFFYPTALLVLMAMYWPLELVAWWRTGRRDSLVVVLLFPLFSLFRMSARFVAFFYWFRVKYSYLVDRGFHTIVPGRNLLGEYLGTTLATATALVVGILAMRNVLGLYA
jgi:cellulose synthase/poly-beta-1,6-N-acetylglucosamine synthase-like glycosyltransferase